MGLAGVLPGWCALWHCRRCSSVWLQTRGSGSHQTRDATLGWPARRPRPSPAGPTNLISGSMPHLAVPMFCCQRLSTRTVKGRDHRKRGSWEDEPAWPGAHHQLSELITAIKYVSGEFSTACRSTISTNCITKTLLHCFKQDESPLLYVYFLFYHHRSHDQRVLYCRQELFCIFP